MKTFFTVSLLLLGVLTSNAQNYYTVKFPNDTTIQSCGLVGFDAGYPQIYQTGYCPFAVGVAMHDQIFYLGSGQSCAKILRRWRLIYWCDYDPNWTSYYVVMNPPTTDEGPTVSGNAWNHGFLEYTQVIKILDGGAPKFLNCPSSPVTFCDYTTNDPNQYRKPGIDLCEGPVDLIVRVSDACSKSNVWLSYRLWLDLDGNGTQEKFVSSSDSLAWPIETTVTADTLRGRIKFPPGFGLPYAKHRVQWIAMDGCGNQSICQYEFIVKDCGAPTVLCYNGLSVDIMYDGTITLWDVDFIKKAWDNCTPENQLVAGIRKTGSGSGFPNNQHSVTFTCDELGVQYVDVWKKDAAGNGGYCTTYVDVQDNMGACGNLSGGNGTQRSTGGVAQWELPAENLESEEREQLNAVETLFSPLQPNPTTGLARLRFQLARNGEVRLSATDLSGRVLFAQSNFFEKGTHETLLDFGRSHATGLVLLKIEHEGGASVQKVLLQRD